MIEPQKDELGLPEKVVFPNFHPFDGVVCTKEHPWDKKTLPVTHSEADFVDDTDMLACPNCGYNWSLGPDV